MRRAWACPTLAHQASHFSLASGFTEDTVGAVFKAEGRDVKGCWERQQKKLADIRTRLAQIHERRGACTQEMQSLAADRQLAHATLELGAVEAQLSDAKRRWKILSVIGNPDVTRASATCLCSALSRA